MSDRVKDADKRLIIALAERTMQYPFKVWGFGEGVALEALWEAADVTGHTQYRQFVFDLFERWLQRPLEEPDHSAPGMLLLMAYQATSDERYLRRAIDLAKYMLTLPRDMTDAAFHRPQHPAYHDYLYVDCMEVDAPFLCNLAFITDDHTYYDAAANQILSYAELLQDDATGLFFHQYNDTTGQTNGAFWGRGNGWALLGLLKTLNLLPETHEKYPKVRDRYVRLCHALADCQAVDGSWHTVLNRPSTYKEASLPAMLGHGIQVGIQKNYLEMSFDSVVQSAWLAMKARIEDGLLTGVSIATPPGNTGHYNSIKTGAGFPWGQGPALLFVMSNRP